MNSFAPFFGMRLRRLRNAVLVVHRDATAKTVVVTLGLTNVLILGVWVSYRSLEFIEGFQGIGPSLNDKMLALLFFALLVLVVLSTVLISYTTLFLARETGFFFQHPAGPRTVLFVKMLESISFSSWASVFLCLPVLISFGAMRGAGPLYYVEALAVLVTFLLFAGLLGTLAALLVAPLVRKLSPAGIAAGGALVLAGLGWVFFRSFAIEGASGEGNFLVLDRLATGLAALNSLYSPSLWASTAILAASEGNHRELALHGSVLLANTLIFFPLLSLYGRRVYGRMWLASQDASLGAWRARQKRPRAIGSGLACGPTGALFVKDFLVFVRSPSQLSQSLLFILLMLIYSLSLLQVPRSLVVNDQLGRFIYFSNLAAVCMILSSFTSRFLFPLLSLEGRAFWIVGLAPMPRIQLIRQKAYLGFGLSVSLGVLTIVASSLSLGFPVHFLASSIYTVVLAAACLAALATGLGAAYPCFDEDNPARIAVGLGGTLNFFASALTVAVLIALQALPYLVLKTSRPPVAWIFGAHVLELAFASAVAVVVLRLGGRALVRSEF